ncbi:MAG: DUF1294 domain-containing protein [Clostridiales bacterium]|nr:DUF1294 domain-containing protein [Clostridiales bacterium]
MLKTAGIYLILINIISFIQFGLDKYKARKGMWRIPEATLLLSAAVGGALGAWIGMFVFHHKTKHLKFILCVPLFLLLHILLLFVLIRGGI